ncbi:prolyl 4-hydroxylase subunit alpha-1 [Zootermopsis nevadensis]|uniref:procollagen-proline 4-dioxygenase n=1 Tax=Zootermopsis nevadensis TaxID=136037 RepID=A0A067RK41_ZOONE|nr:prolyl 4-hydroxylase subunit alpha-1 [Zootermopsis nevadensis]XP_021918433.1 prolyl 4-hydroxylase subunit alpha-1 [Zootermopsis nevadensis]XP_021918442.1 prolyl 4-hydroxylase subunit alpha-1 [Zootermopsis nevadensis]XP_021918452.1 prolyl 4-hydroxylase subunit alpha-1 [Zootermopsis nevadensis]KDR24152.1 Prolyl 4-hydroxylase subunit alpha-2 [Zootermopsis nevadensis]
MAISILQKLAWAASFILSSWMITGVQTELYTCLADMEELLETEALLIRTLNGYIQAEEEKLQMLRRHAADYAREHEEASEDVQSYLSNPINAYLLVKRLTTDWKEVETQMVDDVGKVFIQNITKFRDVLKFPSDEDLNGAAVALTRLQDTYKLDTASVARGELNGIQYSTELSAGDCFELGRQSYNNGDYYHTVLWMTEALQRYEDENNKTTTKSDILEYLAFSTYKEGNVHRALKLTNELLDIVPSHQRALGNKVYYLQDIEKASKEQKRGDDGTAAVQSDQIPVAENKQHLPERDVYEMHCRLEHIMPASISSKLKCRYTSNGNAFLRLARVKEEEAYLKPLILIYHDVIYDDEIETIKKLAMPRFKRATVQNSKTGELETANYRISKSAWLRDDYHPHVAAVNRRVEDITGLTVNTAEELQVVNYGIGGHYEPHFDFARKEESNAFKSLGTGNRIATFLFYMSDVSQGGATVFPQINVALRPEKGAAAFWYNLHRSGEGDMDTRHAACPVLTGSKWVSNKWLHERGQEFKRPCGLTFDTA